MRRRRIFGSVAVVTTALILTIGVAGPPSLELRLIAEPDAAPAFEQARPKVSNCSDCEKRTLRLVDGKVVTIPVEKRPRLVLAPSDIEQLRVGEVRSIFDPDLRYWEVIAVPGARARNEIEHLIDAYPAQRVLVSVGHEPLAIDATPGLEAGVIAGQFTTKEDARRLVMQLGIKTEWIQFDERGYSEDRQWYEQNRRQHE